ncbi:MAG: hypothetical protein M3Y13_14420 [Armatimonadota bacterium]|nr:hypothetical protein [Armatimonadota bacterium]
MKISSYVGVCVIAEGLLLPSMVGAAPKPAPAPAPGFTSRVTATPARAKVGKDANLSVSLVNKGATVPGANVDLEVFNAQNKKIAQHTWGAQNLAKGKSSAYHWAWKPVAAGTYTVKFGVFSRDWKTLRYWSDKALILPAS